MLKKAGIISPYVFPAKTGNFVKPRTFFKHWDMVRKKYGFQCSIQELRHTFISITKSSVPSPLLKRIVGHSKTMDTFGVYGHEVDGEMENAAEIIGDTFGAFLQ